MKISFKPFAESQIAIEINADREVDVFQALSRLQDIFGEKSCGIPNCKSTNIKFQTRQAKSQDGKPFTYHEMVCLDCGAKLQYGQHNNNMGTLFPKRNPPETRGWAVFQPQTTTKSPLPLPPRKPVQPPPEEQWEPQDITEDIPF